MGHQITTETLPQACLAFQSTILYTLGGTTEMHCSYLLLRSYNMKSWEDLGMRLKNGGMRLIIYVLLYYSTVFMILGSLIVTF